MGGEDEVSMRYLWEVYESDMSSEWGEYETILSVEWQKIDKRILV